MQGVIYVNMPFNK